MRAIALAIIIAGIGIRGAIRKVPPFDSSSELIGAGVLILFFVCLILGI